MITITTNTISPSYAAVVYEYFLILNRHEFHPAPDATPMSEQAQDMCDANTVPTTIGVCAGRLEFSLWFDIARDKDNVATRTFAASFDRMPDNDDLIPELVVSNRSGTCSGYTIGFDSELASRIIKKICDDYFAIISPIEKTVSKKYWE